MHVASHICPENAPQGQERLHLQAEQLSRSRPNVLAKRLRALAPPDVSATTPIIPANPMIISLPESPIARPHRALIAILEMN